MKRAPPTLPDVTRALRAAIASTPALVGGVLTLLGCQACERRAAPAECAAMIARYLDMTVPESELGPPELPEAAVRAARDASVDRRKNDARTQRVQAQCEAEVSRREYRCAMKAPSPETWQACID